MQWKNRKGPRRYTPTGSTPKDQQKLSKHSLYRTLRPLSSLARLDTCVTVIDAANFGEIMGSVITVQEDEYSRAHKHAAGNAGSEAMEEAVSEIAVAAAEKAAKAAAEGNRTLPDLMVDQIEFADVIIINKLDIALPAQVGESISPLSLARTLSSARV